MKQVKKTKKKNLLLYSELANLTTYKKKFSKHTYPYKKKELPILFYIKQTSFFLKKNLQIIYKYNFYKKKIMWVGEGEILAHKKKIFYYTVKKEKHSFVPKSAWMNGLISNQNYVYKHLLKTKNNLLKQINRDPELNIAYNPWDELNSECYTRRIPQIILNTNIESQDYYIKNCLSYYLPVNTKTTLKKKSENFFNVILTKIIKLCKNATKKMLLTTILKLKKKPYSNNKKVNFRQPEHIKRLQNFFLTKDLFKKVF